MRQGFDVLPNEAGNSSGVPTIQRRGTSPVWRQTKTVSITDDPVPLIWIEAPISAGHGSEAEQVRPASRIATAIGT